MAAEKSGHDEALRPPMPIKVGTFSPQADQINALRKRWASNISSIRKPSSTPTRRHCYLTPTTTFRILLWVEFSPKDLRLGLVQASQNKIGNIGDQVLLYCYTTIPGPENTAPLSATF